ncbi:uncharacterized protein [Ambystoma mexicanum]|uniref:uncharacterized protein isoform X2 n=1 Tax=Ambystoma mexicanum TaxID=8296 RepID=UPI0037E93BEB
MPRKSQRLLGLGEVSSDESSRQDGTEETNTAACQRRTSKRRPAGLTNMDAAENYTTRTCRENPANQSTMRAIAAPPAGGGPRSYWEAKFTGTPPCSSSNSDSDISTVAEPTGLTYAQGTGLPSLSLTLLLVAALLVKRKLSENRKLLLVSLCVIVGTGLLYLIGSEIYSCKTDGRLVLLLQKQLKKAENERKWMDKRNRVTERKLREMVKVATALLEQGTFESEGEDLCEEDGEAGAPHQKWLTEQSLSRRCKERKEHHP